MRKRNPNRELPLDQTPAPPIPEPALELPDDGFEVLPWEILNAMPEEGEDLEPKPLDETPAPPAVPCAIYESDALGHKIGNIAQFNCGTFITSDPNKIAALDDLIARRAIPPCDLRRIA